MYKRQQSGWQKHLDFIAWDLLCLATSYVLAYLLRHGNVSGLFGNPVYISTGLVLLIFDMLIIVLFDSMNGILRRPSFMELASVVRQDVVVFGLGTVYLFTVKDGDILSRTVLWLTLILHILTSFAAFTLWKRHIARRRISETRRSMLLVADRDMVEATLARFKSDDDEIGVVGLVIADDDACEGRFGGIPVVCALDRAPEYICREWIDEVYICTRTPPRALIDRCSEMGVTVHRELHTAGGDRQFVEKIANAYVITSAMKTGTPGQAFAKRAMDIAGGLVGSLAALVVIAILGPRIKRASPGPILFKQERVGRNGKHFKMYKLRSMYMDAEDRKKEMLKDNRVADGRMFKLDFDPRIIGNERLPDGTRRTGIGAFIRRHSLDEFPQFFNVLMGQMSLVGTRPPTLDEWEKYEFHHRARLAFKPGMTGMWQTSGRSSITDFEEVVKLDTEYINTWSLGLDIRILLKTVVGVIRDDGAM